MPSPDTATAVTMGEPAGIASEIALKAWLRRQEEELAPFFLIADPDALATAAEGLDLPVHLHPIAEPSNAVGAFDEAVPVLPIKLDVPATPGMPDAANTRSVLESIEKAVTLALGGSVNAVVTNPIHKGILGGAGFTHAGHTDYLQSLTGADHAVMLLVSPLLKVVPATVHVGLRDAVSQLSTPLLADCIETVADALQSDFGVATPRVAVTGLNPHAGESGLFGFEEELIIGPAIDAARRTGIDVRGPFPADSLFHAEARKTYDVAVCMYHDQALIPLKTLDFERSVNVTLGLPIVRTSPDHGTALDIAGRGMANPDSLIEAIKLAQRISARRQIDGP